jgi:stress response protein SCP2
VNFLLTFICQISSPASLTLFYGGFEMVALEREVVKRTFRVPVVTGTSGNGQTITRQLDAALMKAGFKLSQNLLERLNSLHPVSVKEIADNVLPAVQELVGDHVNHNVYFRDFPENVPDTTEFWMECIADALFNPDSAAKVALSLSFGVVSLLDLPKYGNYQHSYEEMVAAHEQFIPSVNKDRATILHLGKSLPEEALDLYYSLAGSPIPLNESDRELLQNLAEVCLTDPQPETIPVRENKAIINRVRLENGQDLLVDMVTDVLRLACALSDGDVTLQEKTKFKSFSRKVRRAMMNALESVVSTNPAKLADVNQYSERWKRLAKNIHPYEYAMPNAQDVFAVARGDKTVRSFAAKVELAFTGGKVAEAISMLAKAPGMLFRSLDRIIRAASEQEVATLLEAVKAVIPKISGRVVLSLREHLQNRMTKQDTSRVFANSKGKAWVEPDTREPLESGIVDQLFAIIDEDLLRRMPTIKNLLVDQSVMTVAVPTSDKSKAAGFAVAPRGTIMPVVNGILRFFMYWKQHHHRTDYDLSALMLDADFQYKAHVSWTDYGDKDGYAVYSGDLTEAAAGASEFIDINLAKIDCNYIIPQVNVYSGESFQEAEESFFGFMERTPKQMGQPFEAATVRIKSDVRGKGKVALPIVFIKDEAGNWSAKWLHLYLNGSPNFNTVEGNRLNTALLAKAILDREYLTLEYLVGLMQQKAGSLTWYKGKRKRTKPVTFVGLEAPEGLPEDSKMFTLANLQELIPA